MTILYLILPLALMIAGAAVVAFIWVVRSGQLDDVETPPRRILFDDERAALSSPNSAMPSGRKLCEPIASNAESVGSDVVIERNPAQQVRHRGHGHRNVSSQ